MYEQFERAFGQFFRGYDAYMALDSKDDGDTDRLEGMIAAMEKQIGHLKAIREQEATTPAQRNELGICIGFAHRAIHNIFLRALGPSVYKDDDTFGIENIQSVRDYADWGGLAGLWFFLQQRQRRATNGAVIALLNMRQPSRRIFVEYPDLTSDEKPQMGALLWERGGVLAVPAYESVNIRMSSIPWYVDVTNFALEGLGNEIRAYMVQRKTDEFELKITRVALEEYCTFLYPGL